MYSELLDRVFQQIEADPVFENMDRYGVRLTALKDYGDRYVEPIKIKELIEKMEERELDAKQWNSISQALSRRMKTEYPNAIKIDRRLKALGSRTRWLWYGIKLKTL